MNAGVFEQVVANRLAWGQLEPCAECVGYVALLDAEHIGTQVWLQAPGREVEGPFLVADVANRHNRTILQRNQWVVEVDWQTAQRWGMRGPLAGVRVYFDPPKPPPQECYIDKPCNWRW
jgi:hypothetical protein